MTQRDKDKHTDPPPTRRRFVHAWDEIDYLYDKGVYWLTIRHSRRRALKYIERLKTLLNRHDRERKALLGAMARALVAAYDGDLPCEIRHTERSVEMIQRAVTEVPSCRWDWEDVRTEMEILAALYSENGENRKALHYLKGIRTICRKHGVDFDEADLRRLILSD